MSQRRLHGIWVHLCEGQDQIALWERRMFHLDLCEREGPSYLEEVQMRPDLVLRQRRQRVLPGRGEAGDLNTVFWKGLDVY